MGLFLTPVLNCAKERNILGHEESGGETGEHCPKKELCTICGL
jgi:hypothetical protein